MQPGFHFARITLAAEEKLGRRCGERTRDEEKLVPMLSQCSREESQDWKQGAVLVVTSGRILETFWSVNRYSHAGKQ